MTALLNGRTLDDQSFLNMITFYRDELLTISEGEVASRVLPKSVRRRIAKGWMIIDGPSYAKELLACGMRKSKPRALW